jgi:choline-sulfatase
MAGKKPNVLFIFSDEHDPRHMGISGSPIAYTPNLDRLARGGTRFVNAFTPCPICVPARASLATGLPVHEIGYWDNAIAYDGEVEGWGHVMQANGHRVESIGKLHFVDDAAPTGFARQQIAMHIWEGIGQVWGMVRDPLPKTRDRDGPMLKNIGPGWSNYNQFDADVAESAADWIHERGASPDDKPWELMVGLVAPHFPLVAPQEFFDHYPLDALEPSKLHPADGYQQHPWIARKEEFWGDEQFFTNDPERRKLAIAGYLALCSFVDEKIGLVLQALEESGQADNTLVVYTSDHGDNLGARGLWGKSNMYLESSAVPMILSGPDVPAGDINYTPVSLIDLHATFLDAHGLPDVDDDRDRPSQSMLDMLGSSDQTRTVLSEYHATASPTGGFLAADGRWKYHYYVDYAPELFDTRFDPEEINDLGADPAYAAQRERMHGELVKLLGGRTPEEVDRMAKDDQNALVEKFGGREKALTMGTPAATPVPGKGHE